MAEGRPWRGGRRAADQGRERRIVVGFARRGIFTVQRNVRHAREHLIAAGGVGIIASDHRANDGHLVGELRVFGSNSPITSPGVWVCVTPNSPRISWGASGFGSKLSWCGIPPPLNRTMTDLAVGGRPAGDQREARRRRRNRPATSRRDRCRQFAATRDGKCRRTAATGYRGWRACLRPRKVGIGGRGQPKEYSFLVAALKCKCKLTWDLSSGDEG